jgi:shikimate kinase
MTSDCDQSTGKPIALIGFRGSGKTSVAREIARVLGGDFVDTDVVVTDRVGKSIADIFADEGEPVFRRYESEAIASVVENPPSVISVGGGAVLDSENVRRLRETCFVVCLTAPADVLWQRISSDPESASSRPSLTEEDGLAEVRSVLAKREPLYRTAAHAEVETAGREIADLAEEAIVLAHKS